MNPLDVLMHNDFSWQENKLTLDGWWEASLPSTLYEVAAAFQCSTGASSEIIVATILAAMGTLASSHYIIESADGRNIPLNTFFLVAAESGQGKSSAQREILRPFFNFEGKLREESSRLNKGSAVDLEVWQSRRSALKKRLSNPSISETDFDEAKMKLRHHLMSKPILNEHSGLILTDPTLSGLLEHLSTTRRGTLIANADSGKMFNETILKNLQYYCSIWSSEAIAVKKRHQSFYIGESDLTMLLMLQPIYLTGLFGEKAEFRQSGMAARTLFLKANTNHYSTRFFDNDYAKNVRDSWEQFISSSLLNRSQAVSSQKKQKQTINVSVEAENYLANLHDSAKVSTLPGREMCMMIDYAVRKKEHVLRISALFAVASGHELPTIELDDVQRSERFVNTAFEFARHEIYRNSEEAKTVENASRVLDFILGRIREGRVFYNGMQPVLLMMELMQYGPVRKKADLDKALSFLFWRNNVVVGAFNYEENGRIKTRKAVYVNSTLPLPVDVGWYIGGNQIPPLI